MIPVQPRAGARVHLVAHRVNGTVSAYQRAGAAWRLFIALDDGSTVVVGAHEARYVDDAGQPGEAVMPPPPPSPAADDAARYRAVVALAEALLAGRSTHGPVQGEALQLAAAVVDLWHLARGLRAGDAAAAAQAALLFTPPVTQGVTHG